MKITQHWVGYDGDRPFVYLLTSNIFKNEASECVKYSETDGPIITLDIFIAEANYLGKGLAPLVIKEFLLSQFSDVTEVFIDPEKSNEKATHVYEKVGFKKVGDFIASWHPVPHHIMRLDIRALSNMHIRHAIPEDAASIQILLEQLGYTLTVAQVLDRINAFNRDYQQLIVAEKDNTLVGCIGFGCYEHLVLPGRCCNIDTLIVEQNNRGKGIGTALVQHAEAYAVKNHCVTVELVSANHRKKTGTHRFYQDLGYRTHDEQDYTYLAKKI